MIRASDVSIEAFVLINVKASKSKYGEEKLHTPFQNDVSNIRQNPRVPNP
jgi:hypothetical protein